MHSQLDRSVAPLSRGCQHSSCHPRRSRTGIPRPDSTCTYIIAPAGHARRNDETRTITSISCVWYHARGARVSVAVGAARAGGVERLEAVLVERAHLAHTAHFGRREHRPALVPERLEDLSARSGALVLLSRVPVLRAPSAGTT